ncbi:MAG: FTR1 family protein [Candidatus Hodarchaeota archaeon]
MVVASIIVALREGVEVALIIVIMLAYLKKSQQMELKMYVLSGAVLATITSVGIAFVMSLIWGTVEGPVLSVFEGVVVLIAALLLTTMVVWMQKVGPQITEEIESSMKERTDLRNASGLLLLSFALVLREGVELVFFTFALAIENGLSTYLGVALGLVISGVVGIGVYQGSLRISLKSFFKWTSFLLIVFAAGMIAYGIHELQEAGLLLIGPLEIWDINPPLLPDGSYPLFHENGIIGSIAKSLLGYNGNPSGLEVVAYASYLILMTSYYARNSISNTRNEREKTSRLMPRITS